MSSITSSQFGAQQYTYDDDGRLIKSVEPSGGGVTGAAQMSYSYYPNGTRAGVSVSSAAFTQPNALTYAYRADGLLKTQSVNAFATGSWAKQYTDAGRLTGVSGADAQTRSYDASGQLSAFSVSGGSATYAHDPEGSVLTAAFSSTAPPPSGFAPYTVTSTINVRGELVDHLGTRTRTNSGCLMSMSFPYPPESYDASTDESLNPQNCDRVNGVDLSPNYSAGNADYNGISYPVGHVNTVGFDLTGRLVHSVSTFYGFAQWDGSGNIPGPIGDQGDPAFGYRPGPTGARALAKRTILDRTYDVENHLRTLQYTVSRTSVNAGQGQTPAPFPSVTPGAPLAIAWGPNGHPISLPGYTNPPGMGGFMTLHWDGDTILFVTDGGGNVVDFKVGIDGDITPRDSTFAGLTVYDRDAAGVIVQASNARGSSGFSPLDPSPLSGQSWTYGPTVQAQYVRSDGFMIVYGIQINGVRAYDANVATWTTPDAYEGEIRDPASQQKYMWNRGNAVDYRDPSGFDSFSLWDFVFRITHPWNSGEALKLSPNAIKPFAERMANFRSMVSNRTIRAAAKEAVTGEKTGIYKGRLASHLEGFSGQMHNLQRIIDDEKILALKDARNSLQHEQNMREAISEFESVVTKFKDYLQRFGGDTTKIHE